MQDCSYEPFSREPEYLELNQSFIQSLEIANCDDVLDLACGTGTLTETILESAPHARVTGVDLDTKQLEIARAHFTGRLAERVEWIEGSADSVPLADESFDYVVMGNAIHILPDLARLLAEVRRLLRPGGRFSFNTSFFAGTFAPGTEGFYLSWMKEALKQLLASGETAKRVRGTVPHANARPWLSSEDFKAALIGNGFRSAVEHTREMQMTRRSFETVGAYQGLSRVLLSGYPPEKASAALSASAGAALEAADLVAVPRLWLEMTGERTA